MPPTLTPKRMFTLGIWFTIVGLVLHLAFSRFTGWLEGFFYTVGQVGYELTLFIAFTVNALIIPFGVAFIIGSIVLRSLTKELVGELTQELDQELQHEE